MSLREFWREDDGQDLIEYSLLITFIAAASLILMGSGNPAVRAIWQKNGNNLNNAASLGN